MKKAGILLLSIMLAVLATGFVYAAEPGGATVSSETDLGEITAPTAGQVSLEAGNITSADLDTNQSTLRWVGLLGSVSGNIVLGDASDNSLFTWTAEGNLVYASTGTPDWTLLNDGIESEILAIDTWVDGVFADNYSSTFLGGSESIGSNIFTTISSDYATTTSADATVWKTYSLEDGSISVYAGKVVPSGFSYDNSTVDYQMIIPENGVGNTAATAYNLWVELI